jgi:hypothetical protein
MPKKTATKKTALQSTTTGIGNPELIAGEAIAPADTTGHTSNTTVNTTAVTPVDTAVDTTADSSINTVDTAVDSPVDTAITTVDTAADTTGDDATTTGDNPNDLNPATVASIQIDPASPPCSLGFLIEQLQQDLESLP